MPISHANRITFHLLLLSYGKWCFQNCSLKLCCNTLSKKLTIVIFVTEGCVSLCTEVSAQCLWEFHAETSVQLGSDILILFKWLAGGRGSMTFLTSFCDIKPWNQSRNAYKFVSIAWVLKTKVSGKQSHCHTPHSRFKSVIKVILFMKSLIG